MSQAPNQNVDSCERNVSGWTIKDEAFRHLINQSSLIVSIDTQGAVVDVNSKYCDLTGFSKAELVGSGYKQLFDRDFYRCKFKQIVSVMQSGTKWRGPFASVKKNGNRIWIDTTIIPVFSDSKELIGYFAFGFEIFQKIQSTPETKSNRRDSLTGLLDRASFLEAVQHSIDKNSENYALLLIDLDRFKLINDSFGHEVGDKLLIEMAQRIEQGICACCSTKVARLGGDEFAIYAEGFESHETTRALADRLFQAFTNGFEMNGISVHPTISIGIATNKEGYTSALKLLSDADFAMYEAKRSGRNCFIAFDPSLREKTENRIRIESDLRNASSRKEFFLKYQPIVSLETGALEGVESLIRWNHPTRGTISPDEFIPIAEETGLIVPIGEWVIDEACRQFVAWQNSLGLNAPGCIHVNVSRRQLVSPDLVEFVKMKLAEHEMPAECLHLEVTESTMMNDMSTAVDKLGALQSLGIKIDMDDFGTAYSSLSCLHEIPVNVLKIDRGFVARVNERRDLAALLHAMATLADNLGLEVVAEGIEDADQVALLQSLGCQYGQGFFFAKPISPKEIEEFISTRAANKAKPSLTSDFLGLELGDIYQNGAN